jgi:hypothetical protein
VINDLGALVVSRMTFVNHIGSIVSKSARMLGFIKRISREFNNPNTYKTLYVAFIQVWSMHRACGRLIQVHSARIERIQHNFERFALRGLGWTAHTQRKIPLFFNNFNY